MSTNAVPDEASFLQTRDPSIWGWDQRIRFVAPVRKQLFNQVLEEEAKSEKAGISTYLRLKPAVQSADQATLSILNETTVVTNAPKESVAYKTKNSGRVVHQYSFTKVFGSESTQKEIFDECVAYQVKDFILGSNFLLFAYGTTNAGKTFTIQGKGTSPGIIPRSLDLLFRCIGGQVAGVGLYKPDKVNGIVQLDSATVAQELDYKNRILQWNWDKPLEPIKCGVNNSSCNTSGGSESDFISNTFREMQKTLSNDTPVEMSSENDQVYGVWISFAEVYNENIYDLLDPILHRNQKRMPLKMAQDGDGNTFIRDLKMIHVSSGDEAFHVMLYGKANLQVAATNMNSHSSRSHCIFTIRLVRYANTDEPSFAIVSSFTFCDLAGAERAKKTLNVGNRLKESNNINTSLHVLGRCLAVIRENQKRNVCKPVPYRDSKLTRLFQRALTGHERISMIVNANIAPVLYDETVNVLKFSAIAKQIVVETPIKKPKHQVKKSRFSLMVFRPNPHGTMCWDDVPEDETTSSQRSSSNTCIQQYNAQNEDLLALVEKLRQQVAEEREKNLTLERNVRLKVSETFSKIIHDMESSFKTRLEDVEARNENLSAWRLAQLENFYKQQLEGSRKRRRQSDADDSVIECTSPRTDNRVKELEEEVQHLEEKCSAVHQLLKEAQDVQATLSAENSSLKFDISVKDTELDKYRRQLLASEKENQGSSDALVRELQEQLSEERKNVASEIKKNESLRKLLSEAKEDFLVMSKDQEEAQKEAAKLENELYEKIDELTEAKVEVETTNQLLAESNSALHLAEEKYESLFKIHEKCMEDFSGISAVLKAWQEHEDTRPAVEQIQTQLSSLSVNEGSEESKVEGDREESSLVKDIRLKLSQFIKLKADLHRLQYEAEVNRATCTLEKEKEQKSDILSRIQMEKSELEAEVSRLKSLVSENSKLKENSTKADQLQEETKLLQKDLKDMLQKNISVEQQLKDAQAELGKSQTQLTHLEKELKSVLQKSSPQLNLSMPSQVELETLGSKVKSYEEMIKILKDWTEESKKNIGQLKSELNATQDENRRLEDELKMKDSEVLTIHAHRTELCNRYEDSLRKAQEEVDREKREVIRLRDALYKSTPKKNESDEIRRLKERIESLEAELSLKKTNEQSSSKKVPKSGRKVKEESLSSNESLKENAMESFSVPTSASKQKKRNVELKDVPSSDSKVNSVRESCAIPPPQSEGKPQRKGRKLFSRNQTMLVDTDEVEAIEVECLPTTTPESFVKRSLRNRKV